MSKTCPKNVQDMSKKCPEHVGKMSGTCRKNVRNMSETCLKNVWNMSDKYPKHVGKMSEACPKHVRNMFHGLRGKIPRIPWFKRQIREAKCNQKLFLIASNKCPKNAKNMSQQCPNNVQKMSGYDGPYTDARNLRHHQTVLVHIITIPWPANANIQLVDKCFDIWFYVESI